MQRGARAFALSLAGFLFAAPAFAQQVTPLPSPTPSPVPTRRPPPKLGPVLVGGKTTYAVSFSSGATQTATASQFHAPYGSYFTATPSTLCLGVVKVAGPTPALAAAAITSSGPFTFTRLGTTSGCSVTISSSAGGASATVVFQ
jgi:hypothetical protein